MMILNRLFFVIFAIAVGFVCSDIATQEQSDQQPPIPDQEFVCQIMEMIVDTFRRKGTQFAVLLYVPQTAQNLNDVRALLHPNNEGTTFRYTEPSFQPNERCRTHAEMLALRGDHRPHQGHGNMNELYSRFSGRYGNTSLWFVVLYSWIHPCVPCGEAIANDFTNRAVFRDLNRPVYVGRTTSGQAISPPLTDRDRESITNTLAQLGILLLTIRAPSRPHLPEGIAYGDGSLAPMESDGSRLVFCNGEALEGHYDELSNEFTGTGNEDDAEGITQGDGEGEIVLRKRRVVMDQRKGHRSRTRSSLEMTNSIQDQNMNKENGALRGDGNGTTLKLSSVLEFHYDCTPADKTTGEDKCCDKGQADLTTTAEGDRCSANSSCGYHGQKYVWCNTDKQPRGWDYCCSGLCDNRGNAKYDWCESGDEWDYCQVQIFPYPKRTADGKQCRPYHACGYHDQDYAWCYTDSSNNWGYCCTTNCESYGEAYDWCTTGTSSKWQYCHRDLVQTHISSMGKSCNNDSPCGYYGQTYAWCNTTDGSWDYCCSGDCGNHGNKSDWCTSGKIWKYCKMATLPYPDHTYDLTGCRSNHSCGYHGKDYAWCYTGSSSWDYCCTTDCDMHGQKYDWCTTGTTSNWKYCKRETMPEEEYTAAVSRCRSNHYCGYHGQSYAWCYTDYSNNWDYCCSGTCANYGSSSNWCTSGTKSTSCCCSLYYE